MHLETLEITMLAEAPELGGDVLVFKDLLFVSDSEANSIYEYDLAITDGVVTATLTKTLTSEFYQGPTYLTLFLDEFLYSVNSIPNETGGTFDDYDAAYSFIGDASDMVDSPGMGDSSDTDEVLPVIPLGLIHPGGIVLGCSGPVFYVTNLFFGGVRVVDATNGELHILSPNGGYLEKTSFGLDLDLGSETLFIAGTELEEGLLEGRIFAVDGVSGEELAACPVGIDFYPTDVAIFGGKAYATNSLGSNLVSLDVESALSGCCVTEIIELPEEIFTFAEVDTTTVLGEFTCERKKRYFALSD